MRSVLLLSPFYLPNMGGVETHLDDLSRYLSNNGWMTYVLTYQPLTVPIKAEKTEKKKNLEIHRINWFGKNLFHKLEKHSLLCFLYLTPMLMLKSYFFLRNRRDIEVIHAHGFNASFIAKFMKKNFGVRTIMSTHAIYDLDKRNLFSRIIRWVMDDIDVIFPLAGRSKSDLLAAGISKNKIRHYAQWVDQSIFKPRGKINQRKKLGLKGEFFVLFIGRLIQKKGAGVLLKCAQNLPKVNFIFAGHGPMYDELVKASKTNKNILMYGKKSQKECAELYNSADIFLIPSQYEEGFARVALEAISSGTPVIAANKGCLPEMISPEVGVLIDPTARNYERAIQGLYENRNELRRLTKNCRKYALKNFNERNARTIEGAYIK